MEVGNCYIPLSKKQPPVTIEKDIRPISLASIIATVFIAKGFESLVLNGSMLMLNHRLMISSRMNGRDFTTDALSEILQKLYEITDVTGKFLRLLFLDYSKAFDVINC